MFRKYVGLPIGAYSPALGISWSPSVNSGEPAWAATEKSANFLSQLILDHK